jgi:hypothetical protein
VTVIMADGIGPDAEAIHAAFPRYPVAYYGNGEWAWTAQEVSLLGERIAISVRGNLPEAASYARVLDVENGDATAADVRPYLENHAKLGFSNGTVYCAAASVKSVLDAVDGYHVPRWWIAYWINKPGQPTADEVVAEVYRLTGVSLPVGDLWACQYANHPQWDLSVVYGKPDFNR